MITEPYENYPSKFFAIIFSIMGGLIVNPILYLIIQFERDKHYRTLINQLLSVLIYATIFMTVVLHSLKLYHYTVGYMHWFFCFVDVFLKPISAMLNFLLLDAMCLIRYIFIFHLKNPNGMQDDFWKNFLVMWVLSFACLTNFTYYFLPGSNPNFYYICLGTIPKNHNFRTVKENEPIIVLLLFTILLHIFTALRYQVYKYKEKSFVTEQMTEQQKLYCLHVNQSSIVNFATNVAGVIYLTMTSYVPNKLNVTNPIEFNAYPEYLWLYIFDLYLYPINELFLILVLMYKNPQLRSYCRREISELMKIF